MKVRRSRGPGLSTKLIVLTSSLIIATSLLTGIFVIRTEISRTYESLVKHGRSVSAVLAENSEFGILTGNSVTLRKIIDNIDEPELSYLAVLDENGQVVVEKFVSGVTPSSRPRRDLLKINGRAISVSEFTAPNGKEYLDFVAPVGSKIEPGTRRTVGYVQLGLNKDGLRERIRTFLEGVSMVTLMIILMGVAVTILLTTRILAPIRKLSIASEHIAEGNLETKIDVGAKDEIADLAESFRNMLDRLRASRDEVDARAAELLATNEQISREIIVRKQTEVELITTKARLENLVVSSTAVIYSCVPGRCYWLTFISENVRVLLGYEPQDMIGNTEFWLERVHPDDVQVVLQELGVFLEKEHHIFEYRFRTREGVYLWLRDEQRLVHDMEDNPVEVVGNLIDITERKQTEEQLIFNAMHDQLTGLPNRALFMDRLGIMFARAKRNRNYHFAVVLFDLDNLEKTNERLGTAKGDTILTMIAERLQGLMRASGTFARHGGDEFAILIDDFQDASGVHIFLQRLQNAMEPSFDIGTEKVAVTASVGVAIHHPWYQKPEDLIRDADTALYKAKTGGKARTVVFDASLNADAREALNTESLVRQAFESGTLVLHFQPIVSVRHNEVTGIEALLRVPAPEGKLLLPGSFIHFAEESGLIVPIGDWVIAHACRAVIQLGERLGREDLMLHVNVSPRQFTPDLIGRLREILSAASFEPARLVLELSEGSIVGNAPAASMLAELKKMRVGVQIDQFGSGYASLNYLHAFPIDVIKIDRYFFSGMSSAAADCQEVVRSIVALAHSLNLGVTAEGIETLDQLELVRGLACDYYQGLLFSGPLEIGALCTFLQEAPGNGLRAGREN